MTQRVNPAAIRNGLAGKRLPFALESGEGFGPRARWSFYGAEPHAVFASRGRVIRVEEGGKRRTRRGDPFELLRGFLEKHLPPAPKRGGPPFTGGAVGYFGYDLGRHLERVPARAKDDLGFDDCHVAVYGRIVAFDHGTGRASAFHTGPSSWIPVEGDLVRPGPVQAAPLPPNMTRARFVRAVARAVRYIRAGDIFQVNLSRRFAAATSVPAHVLFHRLRQSSPAPFAAWLGLGDRHVLSSSPERFLKLAGRRVETRPIKGTRPRGATAAEDRRLARELVASEKDRAELAMIVDLERNDLGRVCRVGSVRVEEARALESFPQVHHLVATVSGELAKGKDRIDLLRATFPGGSITGAPKVRAMEIIEELEPTRRSVYTGAIGWIGREAMDLSIAIRTILLEGGRATWQAGAGITAESDPESEERETRAKACGMERALGLSSGDIQP